MNLSHLFTVATFAVTCGIMSCASSGSTNTAAQSPVKGSAAHSEAMNDCPMKVPGVAVQATDTSNGISLSFTTTGNNVDEVRRRVHSMADRHNQHHPDTAGASAQQGQSSGASQQQAQSKTESTAGMGHAMMGHGTMVPATASVEDIEGGARITLTPRDAAQVETLRTNVRSHVEKMKGGECPMSKQTGQHAS